jgi:hypothetical protein
MRLRYLLSTALSLICLISTSIVLPAPAQEDDRGGATAVHKLDAACYVSWWFHSALGYHPAILLKVENASGQNLSGTLIKYQARFTNLRDGYVNVARDEVRASLEPKKQIYVFLKGPRAFELPIDQNLWPKMECKVMCKVGDDDNAGTQTLLISKVDSLTMSFDDAMTLLAKQPDIRVSRRRAAPPIRSAPVKPLVAMAGSLSAKEKPKVTMGQFLTSSSAFQF